MYRQLGLRVTLLGTGASGVASVGSHPRLPAPLRLLLLLAAGGLTLYLTMSITLLVLALAFRFRTHPRQSTDPSTTAWPTP
jgi:hypothetical protein